MSVEANILIRNNTDWLIPLAYSDEDLVPYDFTGSTFRMDVKSTPSDPAALLSLTTASGGIAHTDLANGAITIAIPDYSLAPGAYVFDLVRISGTARETLLFGTLTVEIGVTGL
jgi:hypothetical protein